MHVCRYKSIYHYCYIEYILKILKRKTEDNASISNTNLLKVVKK